MACRLEMLVWLERKCDSDEENYAATVIPIAVC